MPVALAIVREPLPRKLFSSKALHRYYALSFMVEQNDSIDFVKIDALRWQAKITPVKGTEHQIRIFGDDVPRICRLVQAFSLLGCASFASSVSPPWFESISASSASPAAPASPASSSAPSLASSSPSPVVSPTLAVLPSPPQEAKRTPPSPAATPAPVTPPTPSSPSVSPSPASTDDGFTVVTRTCASRPAAPPQPTPIPLRNAFSALADSASSPPISEPARAEPTYEKMEDALPPEHHVFRGLANAVADVLWSFEQRRFLDFQDKPPTVWPPPEPCPAAFAVAVSE